MSDGYREAKEGFVSHLTGSSPHTINSISLTACTTYALWAAIRTRFSSSSRIIELSVLVIPLLLSTTAPLAHHPITLNIIITASTAAIIHSRPLHDNLALKHTYHLFAPNQHQQQQHRKRRRRRSSSSSSSSSDRDSSDDHSNTLHQDRPGPSPNAPTEPFRVAVESPTDSQPHTPYLSPDELRLQQQQQKQQQNPAETAVRISMPIRPFLTIYRAHMMLMTIICILAVDFPIFPRAFAKCETWGTSLMDMGVGSFVFSLGLVSAGPPLRRTILRTATTTTQRRTPTSSPLSPSSSSSSSPPPPPLTQQLTQDLRRSLPILLLGLIRVLLVKSTEYPEHVSEYGLHWNFFITLGLLPFIGTLVRACLARSSSKKGKKKEGRVIDFALLLAVLFQAILWFTPLQTWAISNDLNRKTADLISANKEGIVSFPGYVILYLLGLDLGAYVLPGDPYLAHRLRGERKFKSRREDEDQDQETVVGRSSALSTEQERERTSSVISPTAAALQSHRTSHASTSSISASPTVAATGTASPLHVHVLRHRPNGSLSRLSTSTDGGLSSILFGEKPGLNNGEDGGGVSEKKMGGMDAGERVSLPKSHSDKLAMVLFSFASVWWGLYSLLWLCGAQPSRRIANAMYIVWVSAYNTSFLLGYLLVHMSLLEPLERAAMERAALRESSSSSSDGGGPKSRSRSGARMEAWVRWAEAARREGTTPVLLESLNRHSLLVFLVANVLTGLINLSIKTMYMPDILAFLVLVLYLTACMGTALTLDRYRVRLRF
ncbi:hypothetical protein A4X13_0g6501 [Tilletia indica]|uniref:GPI-anchored wall transfer protein 1 n=1 Tax=Tilletia indica TaxID=43049 RepID=A0A177TW23_9BASI|nr:hypothetical protein A4X13_0g6501 [Tilletia indica]